MRQNVEESSFKRSDVQSSQSKLIFIFQNDSSTNSPVKTSPGTSPASPAVKKQRKNHFKKFNGHVTYWRFHIPVRDGRNVTWKRL